MDKNSFEAFKLVEQNVILLTIKKLIILIDPSSQKLSSNFFSTLFHPLSLSREKLRLKMY